MDSNKVVNLLPKHILENILKAFFQSPLWEPFKTKLQQRSVI
jgi:hypothetical protein